MHIINKLIALILFVVTMAYLPVKFASVLACLVIIWAGLHANLLFYRLTKKIKWVLLSVGLVLSLTTPGQFLFNHEYSYSMFDVNVLTYEGVFLAALHALKLLAMVASIALLLHSTARENLIAGFYLLGQYVIKPMYLKHFVIRLWLVLYYFEHRTIVFNRIQDMHLAFAETLPDNEALTQMTLRLQPYSRIDALIVVLMFISSWCLVGYVND